VTETPVLVQKTSGNKAQNQSNVFRWYSQFQDGRELVEDYERGGLPKSTRTEVKIAAVAANLVKNESNCIKNDSRIFENPQDCSSSDNERGFLLWRFFSCCTIMRLPTKLQVFANFLLKKECYHPLSPPCTLQIYLHQTIFCSPI
jgi:hypothetical protein